MKRLQLILALAFVVFGIAAFLWLKNGADEQGGEMDKPDISRLSSLMLEAADKVRSELLEQQPLVAASRGIVGKSREVMDKLKELNPEVAAQLPEGGVIQGKVEKGDTMAGLLEEAGGDSAQRYINAAAKVFPLRSFRAGQPYAIVTDPATGAIRRFEYEVNDRHRLIVEGDEKPRARIEDIEYVTLLDTADGVIDDNLFKTVADIGENPQLAIALVNLFGSEINFIRDLQEGDRFSVLLEKRFREGEAKGYGRILAARFTNKGKTFEAFMFRDGAGNLQHYNANGENLKKTLLMAPLAVTRLTSRFTHNRKHPILGSNRPHLGVDYGAPTGTPVKAVGNGTVTKRGWAGGYGNQIIIRHDGALESMYAHLSGFARGLAVGQRVRQGQVIGFVGSTGLSTGPHLDFRLRQNGTFINPVKAINPRGAPVPPGLMAAFKRARNLERSYLDGGKLPENYTVDSIIPTRINLQEDKKSIARGKKNPRGKKVATRQKSATQKTTASAKRKTGGKKRR